MDVRKLEHGLWRWTASHPDWTPEEGGAEGWDPNVGCVYCETDDGIVLVDPLVPAATEDLEHFWRALDRDVERAGRPPTVLLTVYWHVRSAVDVVNRYAGARLLAPDGKREESAQRALVTSWISAGAELPGDLQAFTTGDPAELVYWLPGYRALVPGDVLLGDGLGGLRLPPDSWLGADTTRESLAEHLRCLLDLPVERVLVSHGDPVLAGGHDALARALAT